MTTPLKMMEYDEFHAMTTTILVAAEGGRSDLEPGFTQVRRFVAESEQRFSRFRETSELTALNRSAGRWFEASEALFFLVQEAGEAFRLTGGLFDPTILGALKIAGYDRSMDEIRQSTSLPGPMDFPAPSLDFAAVRLDPGRHALWMPDGMQIDLGGIAKGWIAARAAQQLAQFTDTGAVSAGGDLVLFGLPEGEPAWQISLEDPRDASRVLAVVNVGPGAVATSSVTKRRWMQQDYLRHHIIDPRTGVSAASPWLSVTVYTQKASHAEAFAKALLIAGPDKSWELAERVQPLEFVAVLADGSMIGNSETMEITYVPEPAYEPPLI